MSAGPLVHPTRPRTVAEPRQFLAGSVRIDPLSRCAVRRRSHKCVLSSCTAELVIRLGAKHEARYLPIIANLAAAAPRPAVMQKTTSSRIGKSTRIANTPVLVRSDRSRHARADIASRHRLRPSNSRLPRPLADAWSTGALYNTSRIGGCLSSADEVPGLASSNLSVQPKPNNVVTNVGCRQMSASWGSP